MTITKTTTVFPVFFLFFFLTGSANLMASKTSRIDSLITRLELTKSYQKKISIYDEIAKVYWSKNLDSAIYIGNKMVELSKKQSYDNGMALGYLKIGMAYVYKGEYNKALETTDKVLKLSAEPINISRAYVVYGSVYYSKSKFYAAIKAYRKALELALQTNHYKQILACYLNIAHIYFSLDDFEMAKNSYEESIQYCRDHQIKGLLMSRTLIYLGSTYNEMGNYQGAIDILNEAIENHIEESNSSLLGYANNHLAASHLGIDKVVEAMRYSTIAKEYSDKQSSNIYLSSMVYSVKGKVLFRLDSIEKAKASAIKAFKLYKERNKPEELIDLSKLLFEIYAKHENRDSMQFYFNMHAAYSDSLSSLSKSKKLFNEIKEVEFARLEQKKNYEIEKTSVKNKLLLLISVLVSIIIILVILYQKNKKIEETQ